jgi:hypothetical protein
VTARRVAIIAILAVCLGGPIGELFDHWDQTAQDGNDTEANAVIAALCVGLAISVAGIVVARVRAMSLSSRLHIRIAVLMRFAAFLFAIPDPTCSPPTPLRV